MRWRGDLILNEWGDAMRKIVLVALVTVMLASLAADAQDGKTILDAAGRALGSTNLNSIQYSGVGTNNAFGQAYAPGGPWPAFKVTSYTASINYTTPAMRVEFERTNPDGQIRGGGGLPLLSPQKTDPGPKRFIRLECGRPERDSRARRS